MHRATDKMGMAVKRAMEGNGGLIECDRETLITRMRAAVEKHEWVEAETYMAVLWYQEWSQFLSRDFTREGNEPEHATQWCPSMAT